MAVVPAFTSGRLDIMGDDGPNTVLISSADLGGVPHVTVNGLQVGPGVKASDVTSIFAALGGGPDTMDLSTLDLVTFSGLTDRSITMNGGAGQDKLIGTSLADVLIGGPGSDDLRGLGGADEIDGGAGADALYGGDGDDLIYGRGGLDVIFGGNGDDDLRGGPDSDRLFGEGGKDALRGQDGDDFLYGGDGNDRLFGNDGSDLLAGGAENDAYVYPEPDDTGLDTIDEAPDEGRDRINVSQLTLISPVNLASTDVQQLMANQSLRLVNPATVEKIVTGNTIRPSSEGVYTVPGGSGETTPVTFRYGGGNSRPSDSTGLVVYEVDANGYPLNTLYGPDDPLFDPLVPRGDLTIKGFIDPYSDIRLLEPSYPGGTRLAFFLGEEGADTGRIYSMPTMNVDGDHVHESLNNDSGETMFSWEDLPLTDPTSLDPEYGDFDDVILGIGTLTTNNGDYFGPIPVAIGASDPVVQEDGSKTVTFTFTHFWDDGVTGAYALPLRTRPLIVPFVERGDSTALAGKDYTGIPGGHGTHIIVIPVGQATATLTLTMTDDSEIEGDETFGFVTGWGANYQWTDQFRSWDATFFPEQSIFTTIIDDDKVDLDIDSDNSGHLDRTPIEDLKEDRPGEPGKIVAVGGSRVPMVIQTKAGVTADLAITSGADKVKVWTSATGGLDVFEGEETVSWSRMLERFNEDGQSLAGGLWVQAIKPSESAGDVMISLGATGDPANVDAVRFTALVVDLDIDSDNNNGFGNPEGSQWEDDLEVNPYGLGKLVMLDNPERPVTPVVLQLPRNLPQRLDALKVRVDWTPTGRAGELRVWTTSAPDDVRNPGPAEEGGNRVYPGWSYTLSELNYDPQTGLVVLYAEGVDENEEIKTLAGVELVGKPDERIRTTVVLNGQDFGFDEVKYLVANEDSFFYQLQTRQEVRNELASRGVYEFKDLITFCLQPKDAETDFDVDGPVLNNLGPNPFVAGLKAMVYQDYITGEAQYVLAFAGTDDNMWVLEFADWANNIEQGLGWSAPQYTAAMEIGDVLGKVLGVSELTVTGHSLGGGLASAAAVVSGARAQTFNAAGLHIYTLYERDIDDVPLKNANGDYIERYQGSEGRYLIAATFIDAYFVDWDILTFVQSAIGRDAVGLSHELDGPSDLELALEAASFTAASITGQTWAQVAGLLSALETMVGLHGHPSILYGLLVTEGVWGPIEVDMLGYSEYF